jgi:hypothetical protein
MSRVITRGLRRQLKMVAPQQFVPKIILAWKQQHSQVKGIQLVDVLNIEPQ